jgi:histidinol dehydrogenase
MRVKWFEWQGPERTATRARRWAEAEALEEITAEINEIEADVRMRGDEAVLELTNRFDATEGPISALRVDPVELAAALANLDPELRRSLELAAANIRKVAEAQVNSQAQAIQLPQGQTVTLREVPFASAGVYGPGGKAPYPSSVLMCAIPAQVAGVRRLAVASPPDRSGRVHPVVLAAAALCEVDDVYSMGGAQAIFALAHGTQTVNRCAAVVGPGNNWVQEAKKKVFGFAGIDSYAGPSELMLVADGSTNPHWAALDLCAQAEHGSGGPLLVAAVENDVLDALVAATESASEPMPDSEDSPLAVVQLPHLESAVELANAYSPEHLEFLFDGATELAEDITTAGCVFVGRHSATAFGDYAAGSNHVLPTLGAGRFSGPLGPDVFRRKIATVEVPPEAAAKLAPHVETIARAEGFPVHGESAMIRARDSG